MNSKAVLQLLRPLQWSKNAFIFLPLFFNGQLWNVAMLCNCLVSFFAFSFAASSIYCFNDIYDREADRLHPEKCKRPVASGAISKGMAYAVMIICLVISVLILFFAVETNKFIVTGIIALYYLLNIAYCTVLKRYPIVDVTVISVGFVLRVLVGGFATGVELSEWIILMTFLLALFLAFAKRRDDVLLYQSTGVQLRNNTQRYNLDFMNQVITVIATITIIAYIMYTVSPDVTLRFHCKYVYLTSFFVLIGIIRYLQITIVDLKSGNPTKILLKDRFIQVCIMGWIVSFLIIIYL